MKGIRTHPKNFIPRKYANICKCDELWVLIMLGTLRVPNYISISMCT